MTKNNKGHGFYCICLQYFVDKAIDEEQFHAIVCICGIVYDQPASYISRCRIDDPVEVRKQQTNLFR